MLEFFLVLFSLEVLLALGLLFFLTWKVRAEAMQGNSEAVSHLHWYRVRTIVFLFIGVTLFIALSYIQSP